MFKKLKKKCQVKNSIIKHFYDFFFQSVEFHIYNEEYYFKCMYALQMIPQTFDNYLNLSLSTNHNKCFNKTLDYKLLLKNHDPKTFPSTVNFIFIRTKRFNRFAQWYNFCITECNGKSYGQKCQQNCGNCKNNEQCHHVNGSCMNGCDSGFYGTKCDLSTYMLNWLKVHDHVLTSFTMIVPYSK